MKSTSNIKIFLMDIIQKRNLIFNLVINDFKKKYSSSYLGLFWSFAQPIINIGVFWFVFSVGFRASDIEEGVPFILWLVCGLIPWYYFSDVIVSGSNVFYEYSYMLKQMTFKPSILPCIKIFSYLITYLFFLLIIIGITFIYKINFSLYYLQSIYYVFCSIYLVIGLLWLFSSIKIFLPDMGEIISVILQLVFWLTPIVWNIKIVPVKVQYLFKVNPMFYIVDGFRDTFIYKVWFWEKLEATLVFFSISTLFFLLGITIFRKLRPHFNDVL